MAQIDSSIYFQQKPIDPFGSITSGIEQGQKLGDMIRQGRFNNAMRGAMTVDPTTGQPKFDQSKLADLYQADPQRAMQWQQQYQQQQAQMLKTQAEGMSLKADMAARKVSAVKDQAGWDAVKGDLKTMGVAPGLLPDAYSPDAIKSIQNAALDTKTQIENQFKAADQARQERHEQTYEKETGAKIDQNALQRQERSDQHKSQALQQTMQFMEGARGDPQFQQAKKDQYAAAKLNSLIGMGDPNKLSPQMVQLAASEVAKMATGGVPTAEELHGVNPKTIPSSLASLAQYVSNNPQSAQAGEFLKQYQAYANALNNDATNVIYDKVGRVIESKKPYLAPGDYENLRQQYLSPVEKQVKAAKQGGASMADRVQMRAPDGSIRAIPKDQVEAAKAAGGQPL